MKIELIDKIDRFFIRLGYAFSLLFVVVVIIGNVEVFMRYVFDSPTVWVHETTTFLVSLALLYGGVACYADRKHIAMTFIRDRLPPQVRWALELLVEVLTSVFAAMLTYGAYLSARDAFFTPMGDFHMQTSGTALDTPFPALNKGFLFVSCVVFFGLTLLHVYRQLALYRANQTAAASEQKVKFVAEGTDNA